MSYTAQELLDYAIHASQLAGAILSEGYGKPLSLRSKEGMHNIVTQYDIAAERAIIDSLRSATPSAAFHAEESGRGVGTDDLTWIIDPLDGTVNFAHGIPFFCVSIAATIRNALVCGVIYNPLSNELFTASLHGGARLNGELIAVSPTSMIQESILATGFPYNVAENPLGCIEQFDVVVRTGTPVRRLGSAALDLAYTAAGRFDGFWESVLQPWDIAAGVLIVQEAGGKVTNYSSNTFDLSNSSVVATNGHIHDELSALLDVNT
jgi:myo-inositol-1(or 4)-monophosphatase